MAPGTRSAVTPFSFFHICFSLKSMSRLRGRIEIMDRHPHAGQSGSCRHSWRQGKWSSEYNKSCRWMLKRLGVLPLREGSRALKSVLIRLRDGSQVGLQRFEAGGILLLGLLVSDRSGNDDVASGLPVGWSSDV